MRELNGFLFFFLLSFLARSKFLTSWVQILLHMHSQTHSFVSILVILTPSKSHEVWLKWWSDIFLFWMQNIWAFFLFVFLLVLEAKNMVSVLFSFFFNPMVLGSDSICTFFLCISSYAIRVKGFVPGMFTPLCCPN